MSFRIAFAAGVAMITAAGAAAANEFEPALKALADDQIKAIVADPALIAAIRAQNEKHAGLDEGAIIEMDKAWRAEVGGSSTPTIDPVMSGAVADMLRAARDGGEGLFTEIFVMDSVGLNVAASDVTSDYWQGDEAKWQQTYQAGPGAVHISEVELDESTQTYQAQVSVSITDESGAPIGAATFGVNVEYLQ
ncbi:MAG: PDC sensor domain-containing protein [Pseudomonadota bacterium]